MKNLLKLTGIIALAAVIVFALSCSDDKKEAGVFTVTFDPNNGEAVIEVEVAEGRTVAFPADPTRIYPPTSAGLFEGSIAKYTFGGWYYFYDVDGVEYELLVDSKTKIYTNLILKAKWINPDPLPIPVSDPSLDPADPNFVTQAISYVKTYPGAYTIALVDNNNIPYNCSGADLDMNFINLTIIGIDPVTINVEDAITVGALGMNNIELILGDNITLDGTNNTDDTMVVVQNDASFTMQKGSVITKNTGDSSAVIIEEGNFYMNSGSSITGNKNTDDTILHFASGGLYLGPLTVKAVIEGEISGNKDANDKSADITYYSDASKSDVTISEDAVIGSIILVITDNDYTNINIDSSWIGTIDELNLSYDIGVIDPSNTIEIVVNKWMRYPNIITGFVNAEIIKNITLGDFRINGDDPAAPEEIITEGINDFGYLIDDNGKLIAIPRDLK